MVASTELIGFGIFAVAVWAVTTFKWRVHTAALFSVLGFLLYKVLFRFIPYNFYGYDTGQVIIITWADIVTAILQLVLFIVTFALLERNDDTIVKYYGIAILAGVIGFWSIPALVQMVLWQLAF